MSALHAVLSKLSVILSEFGEICGEPSSDRVGMGTDILTEWGDNSDVESGPFYLAVKMTVN